MKERLLEAKLLEGNFGNCCCRCNKGQGQEGLPSFGAEHGAIFKSDGIDPAADC